MCSKKRRARIVYGFLFVFLFLTEVYIALFVKDNFVRPFVGDMLVTLLLGCLVRTFIPDRVKLLPLYVFVFSVFVEIMQYIDIVKLVGLEDNAFISVIVGRSYSFYDILCYAVGCVALFIIDLFFVYGRKCDK